MRNRWVTLVLGISVVGLAVWGFKFRRPSDPVDRVFETYKAKHTQVRGEIRALGEQLRTILKTEAKAPAPRIHIALLSELARLNNEVNLIESWDKGTLNRRESVNLMADSVLVLEYLHMTTLFARSLSDQVMSGHSDRSLASDDSMERAARAFPSAYLAAPGGDTIFKNADVLANSREANRLIPIARALYENPDGEGSVEYRVRFFARYAENILQKNKATIDAFRKSLVQNASVTR